VSAQRPIPAPDPGVCVPLGIALRVLLLSLLAHGQRDFTAAELGAGSRPAPSQRSGRENPSGQRTIPMRSPAKLPR
jgi:hypothetical protein